MAEDYLGSMHGLLALLATACAAFSLGCQASETGISGAWQADRDVMGDTTIVRTVRGSVWRDSVELVEELVMGVLTGPAEYQFGMILDVAVDSAGGIYVFDGQVPALRYYDASGAYRRTLGGQGQGPGEYMDASLGLAVRRSDGRIVMHDPRNARLNVYTSDGDPSDSWRVGGALFTQQAMTLDRADHVYVKVLMGRPDPNKVWPVGLQHLNERGEIVDTIVPPRLPNEPSEMSTGRYSISKVWTASTLGGLVVGVSDRYRLDHYRSDGTVLRIERNAEAATVHPGEKDDYEARNSWQRRNQTPSSTVLASPPLPDKKPVFRRFVVGDSGRIWVHRYVSAEEREVFPRRTQPEREPPPPIRWQEPTVYDVFEVGGAFLGSVRIPPRTTVAFLRGDRVWGIRRGEFDEQYLIRFRISRD